MSLLDAMAKLTAKSGRACRTLIKAKVFAVGRMGAAARISPSERALIQILHEPAATVMLLHILPHASLAGQLYALLGLRQLGYETVEQLFKNYREQTVEVPTQIGCLRGSQPVRAVIEQIQDGTYSNIIEARSNGDN